MLVHNIHIIEGSANRSSGELVDVIKDSKENIKILMIKLDKESH